MLLMNKINPTWIKADLVTAVETVPFTALMNELAITRKNYFRKGISFDSSFRNAFLEEEINANMFFHNWEKNHVEFSIVNMNNYLQQYKDTKFRVQAGQLKDIHLFETVSFFHDGEQVSEQYNDELSRGSRVLDTLDDQTIYRIVDRALQFLTNRLQADGQFK